MEILHNSTYEFKNETKEHRAVELVNGMIISFNGMLLEWEDKIFYGVIEKPCNIHLEGVRFKYIRTGINFSINEFKLLHQIL
ncbi:hypothetical protein ABNX05_11180 [Lysinibacillus sp. M3]|uniref:Phage protein n=1 Tax=Lysinibacillus zambalensis TaxID=3160866 RepID=A0ABV1MRN8_9BACI